MCVPERGQPGTRSSLLGFPTAASGPGQIALVTGTLESVPGSLGLQGQHAGGHGWDGGRGSSLGRAELLKLSRGPGFLGSAFGFPSMSNGLLPLQCTRSTPSQCQIATEASPCAPILFLTSSERLWATYSRPGMWRGTGLGVNYSVHLPCRPAAQPRRGHGGVWLHPPSPFPVPTSGS